MFISDEWFYSSNVSPEDVNEVPVGAIPFQLNSENIIDLDVIEKREHTAAEESIVYNSFEVQQEESIIFGAGVDWFFEAYLNGEKIYSTMARGNQVSVFSPENNLFFAKARPGKNLLAVRVRRGSGSGTFAFTAEAGDISSFSDPLTIKVDANSRIGKIKPMNAVNNGPVVARGDQTRGNLQTWKSAEIPFARNHDAAFFADYGGEHSVDVHAIFPDFSKDPYDPASYDFTLTDRYHQQIMEAGTKVFFRLGSKIEHAPKKYGTKVPPDFQKWAVICEHIIRHCNEGWADGHRMDIEYWEIWNEPDLSSGAADKKTWQGTDEEFFEMYRIAACHLKKCFPHLKIGGPAIAGNREWMKKFLAAMTGEGRVPLDFFSWHLYSANPYAFYANSLEIRKILDNFGYHSTESILNEWNYIRGWTDEFIYSIETIIGLKGATFTAACMSVGQAAPLDMLMYYDARPCAFNGLFDYYTYRPLKGYYAFIAWSKLVNLGTQIQADTQKRPGFFATAATDGKGKIGVLVCCFYDDDELPPPVPVTVNANGIELKKAKVYSVDHERNFEELPAETNADGTITFVMSANTFVFIEQ